MEEWVKEWMEDKWEWNEDKCVYTWDGKDYAVKRRLSEKEIERDKRKKDNEESDERVEVE